MNKAEVLRRLSSMFAVGHVQGWLSQFPDDHKFDPQTYAGQFVDYINSLDTRPIREGVDA